MKDKRYKVGSVHISATNPIDAKEKITRFAINGIGGYICVSNIRMIRYAGKHPEYVQLMELALMNFPDGKPLQWCAHLWGLESVATTNGPSFFKTMLASGDKQMKHYLLGDTQDILDRILEKNNLEFHAQIVGSEALPFAEVNDFDYEQIAARVAKSEANIVWTAMRAPKQDEFNQRLSQYLPSVVCLGVGRAFRLLTGDVKDAPNWAHKIGIAGLFTRKVSLYQSLKWYFESVLFLVGYIMQIIWLRLNGRRCDE